MPKKGTFVVLVGVIVIIIILFVVTKHNTHKVDEFKGARYWIIDTTIGSLNISLYTKEAPETTNFITYLSDTGYYDNGSFYIFEEDYLIQGGARRIDGTKLILTIPTPPLEYNKEHVKGTVGLSRQQHDLNGASTEFFFNLIDNTHHMSPTGVTKGGYTCFGIIVSGWEVLERMMYFYKGSLNAPPTMHDVNFKVEIKQTFIQRM